MAESLRKWRAANPTATLPRVAVAFYALEMYLCYVDESGCTGHLPSATSDIQPIFTTVGLILDQSKIHDFTLKFIYLKRQFFPDALLWDGKPPKQFLDWALFETP